MVGTQLFIRKFILTLNWKLLSYKYFLSPGSSSVLWSNTAITFSLLIVSLPLIQITFLQYLKMLFILPWGYISSRQNSFILLVLPHRPSDLPLVKCDIQPNTWSHHLPGSVFTPAYFSSCSQLLYQTVLLGTSTCMWTKVMLYQSCFSILKAS